MKKYLKFKLKRGKIIYQNYWEQLFGNEGFTDILQRIKKEPNIIVWYQHVVTYGNGGSIKNKKRYLKGFRYEL